MFKVGGDDRGDNESEWGGAGVGRKREDKYRGFFFQAEDGIRDLVRSRGLGDVYKRQVLTFLVIQSGTNQGVESELSPRFCDLLWQTLRALSLIHI